MIRRGTMMSLIAALLLFAERAVAEEKETTAIVEIGNTGEWGLRDGSFSYGPTVAVEVTPIEHWLEIEAGVTSLFAGGRAEWDTDLLFKKPFTLSNTIEFMFGVGPEWVHTTSGGTPADSVAGEAVLDFMFWPSPERKYGWYMEPSYSYDFGKAHEQSLGLSVGLLIPIR